MNLHIIKNVEKKYVSYILRKSPKSVFQFQTTTHGLIQNLMIFILKMASVTKLKNVQN